MRREKLYDDNISHNTIIGEQLKKQIIGQDKAIEAIVQALDRAALKDPKKPVASLMFLGTTGVGKTETAESLAGILRSGEEKNLLRINCAQYSHGHEVANLVGSPPGFVGRDQKPVFNKELIEHPGSVVLFDEIEKGHPKLWNYLLQIMEGGKVQMMNGGDDVNFCNSTVIMTSNVGAGEMQTELKGDRIGFTMNSNQPKSLEKVASTALKKLFKPEFINRLDGIITFDPLDDTSLHEVLNAHISRANDRYKASIYGGMAIQLTPELKQHLIETAIDRKEYGARPVIRNYEQKVETKLSRMALKGLLPKLVEAHIENGEIEFYEDDGVMNPETGLIVVSDELSQSTEAY